MLEKDESFKWYHINLGQLCPGSKIYPKTGAGRLRAHPIRGMVGLGSKKCEIYQLEGFAQQPFRRCADLCKVREPKALCNKTFQSEDYACNGADPNNICKVGSGQVFSCHHHHHHHHHHHVNIFNKPVLCSALSNSLFSFSLSLKHPRLFIACKKYNLFIIQF